MGHAKDTACYRELGAELRKRREAAGITAREVGEYTGWHRTKISRIETGLFSTTVVDAILYLGACDIYRGQARDLLSICEVAERGTGYWMSPNGEKLGTSLMSLIHHESTASAAILYDPMVINGLLQIPDYARTLVSRESWRDQVEVEHCVDIRMERQQILHRPRPGRFTFIVHEQALRNLVGCCAVMHEQLLRIVLLTALDHVSIRVVPTLEAEQGAFSGPFQLFSFKGHKPLVYLDSQSSGLFIEDKEFVVPYRELANLLADVALDEGQSREFVAGLANEFDRGSQARDGGIHHLEEEHL